jgi:hypothetical protein
VSRRILLALSPPVQAALWDHLVPRNHRVEEAAFVYAGRETTDDTEVFRAVEWLPVPPDGFVTRSAVHFELADAMRAAVIKRAHDLGASLVEFHSHTGRWRAAFSPSDRAGFREFVPHVWWRLKGRPYLAVVVTRSGFDGLAWIARAQAPERLDGVLVEEKVLNPTRLSHAEVESDER